ncbi:MAG: hypothetical protein HPY45_07285 [Anaerolineae bacterium]|nr:hypothetical protein [Anaerolineae bacterium]
MRFVPFVLFVSLLLLLSCQLPFSAAQPFSEDEMATRIAQALTSMPAQGSPSLQEPTLDFVFPTAGNLPDLQPTASQTPVVATPAPSETPLVIVVTPTFEPATATPTEAEMPVLPTSYLLPTLTPVPDFFLPTITPPPGDPRDTFGPPTAADPMDTPNDWFWPVGPDQFTDASFTGAYMRLTGLTSKSGWRMPGIRPGDNYYAEIIARPEKCSGRDNFGIIFRVPDSKLPAQGYLFSISCDGAYKLWMWDGLSGKEGTAKLLIGWRNSDTIRKGSEQPNRIGVQAIDNTFTFYINGYLVDTYIDKTFTTGGFGVFVDAVDTDKLTIDIDEVVYWKK